MGVLSSRTTASISTFLLLLFAVSVFGCPRLLAPVCGVDGKNYDNSCLAMKKTQVKCTGFCPCKGNNGRRSAERAGANYPWNLDERAEATGCLFFADLSHVDLEGEIE